VSRLSHVSKFAFIPLVGLTLLPLLLVIGYVATYGNPVPVGDQWWDVGYIAVKTRAGLLTLDDLFMYFSGHRPLLIRLHTVLMTLLTNYDARLLNYMAIVNALLNVGLATLLLRGQRRALALFALPVFALVILTLYHPDSWLDYYFAVWQQPLFFLLVALLILQRARPGFMALAGMILCAVATTFTLGLGLAAWVSVPIAIFADRRYRRPQFLLAWGVAAGLCLGFYFSGNARDPNEVAGSAFSLATLRQLDPLQTSAYLIQFQSNRFETGSLNAVAMILAVACIVTLCANAWLVMRQEGNAKTVAIWLSLAAFALGGAILTALGRGLSFPAAPRYSPGADGFWIAFVALAVLALMLRPKPMRVAINGVLLCAIVVLTIQKNVWSVTQPDDSFPPSCDQCVLDAPLAVDGCFRACFVWSEDQSVYHFAALRLSVFGDVTPISIVPDNDSPVLITMPHRWLSVYVRDYVLAGIPATLQTHIAPLRGDWQLPKEPYSPYYRGEWDPATFPNPLSGIYESADPVIATLPTLLADHSHVWVLSMPDSAVSADSLAIALGDLGLENRPIPVTLPGRLQMTCFERQATGACDQSW